MDKLYDFLENFDWFGLAPYGAGSPPAFVLAINLYGSVMTVVDSRLWFIGMLVAMVGIIGMMAVEIGTYKMLARAFADREWKAAGLAFIGACIVTSLIIFSVYTGADTKSLFSSTAVMLVGYLAIMVREYLERGKQNKAAATNTQLDLLREERRLQNSKNRGAKLSTPVQQVSTRPSGQVDTPEAVKVRAAWAANPGVSQREIARICNVSPMTAGKYKP